MYSAISTGRGVEVEADLTLDDALPPPPVMTFSAPFNEATNSSSLVSTLVCLFRLSLLSLLLIENHISLKSLIPAVF